MRDYAREIAMEFAQTAEGAWSRCPPDKMGEEAIADALEPLIRPFARIVEELTWPGQDISDNSEFWVGGSLVLKARQTLGLDDDGLEKKHG